MQDHQLYQQILGIASPWFVERVELKLEEGDVHVHPAHDDHTPWCCPECGTECPIYDHAPERTWRHLDTCQYQTLLHAAVPRTDCPEDGARTTYAYDAADQLLTAKAAAGTTTYGFDSNGNQQVVHEPNGDRKTTAWDYENQPVLYRLSAGSRVTMAYNADNRRVRKET